MATLSTPPQKDQPSTNSDFEFYRKTTIAKNSIAQCWSMLGHYPSVP